MRVRHVGVERCTIGLLKTGFSVFFIYMLSELYFYSAQDFKKEFSSKKGVNRVILFVPAKRKLFRSSQETSSACCVQPLPPQNASIADGVQ